MLALVIAAIVASCVSMSAHHEGESRDDALLGVDPPVDVPGLPRTFSKDRLMDDAFFTNANWATAAEIQAFLENTVWKKASWLATEKVAVYAPPSSVRMLVSDAIVVLARDHHINPLLLLARMQVEKSLVSGEKRPSESARSFGLGCHKTTSAHPNGLDPSIAALDLQLECAATTLEKQMSKAQAGDPAAFDVNREATTQDGVKVRPSTAATSALYAYTPIEGTKAHNGNWLVWNITRRFAAAIQEARTQH